MGCDSSSSCDQPQPLDQSTSLLFVLSDTASPIEDRIDAALDLGDYDLVRVEAGLVEVANDPSTDERLLEPCGESLGEIWCRKGSVNLSLWKDLRPEAKDVAYLCIQGCNPSLARELF